VYTIHGLVIHFSITLYCYKIVLGLICLDVNKYVTFTSLPTRGHPYKLYKTPCENLKQRSFFTERLVGVWNSLPANVDFYAQVQEICHTTRSLAVPEV